MFQIIQQNAILDESQYSKNSMFAINVDMGDPQISNSRNSIHICTHSIKNLTRDRCKKSELVVWIVWTIEQSFKAI